MASAISRARQQAMKGAGAGAGEWLDNDTLIANQHVFYITDVRDDRGGGFSGDDRWVLRVEPFYDGDEDPEGLVSLTDNPARRKFMTVLDQELESLVEKNEDPVIGPCCMVRLKGKNYRYIEIVDWDEANKHPVLPQGAIPAGARVEEDMRPPRRPRGNNGQAEPEPQQDTRPFAGAVEAKAEASPARRSAPRNADPEEVRQVTEKAIENPTAVATSPISSAPETGDASTAPGGEFPPIKIWARANGYEVPEGRGRVKTEVKEAYEAAKAAHEAGQKPASKSTRRRAAEQKPYQGDTREVEQELARVAAESAQTRPAEVPVSAPNRQSRSEAVQAREILWRPGMSGTSIEACPACGQYIHDRIFPAEGPGSDKYVLVHAGCPSGGEQAMMEAIPDSPEVE